MRSSQLRQKALTGSTIIAGILVVILLVGLSIGSSRTMPENAIVLVDDEARTYFAPPCVAKQGNLRVVTAAEVHDLGYSPDRDCVNEGGFMQDGRSLTGKLLEAIGLFKPLPSRWNADGTWNW